MPQHPYFSLNCPNQKGTLLLTPCPGTLGVGINDSLDSLQSAGATAVVTLMTKPEMATNDVLKLAEQCAERGIEWFHLPIEDEGAPTEDVSNVWREIRARVHRHLDGNQAVVIHCKGGSGRTGVVAAQILIERGVPVNDAMAQIKALRPNAFAHAVQVEYVERLATQH